MTEIDFESGERPPTIWELLQDSFGDGSVISIQHEVDASHGGFNTESVIVELQTEYDPDYTILNDEMFIGMAGPAKLVVDHVGHVNSASGTITGGIGGGIDLRTTLNCKVYYECM